MKACGHVFKYGDNVDTDVIIPARYLNATQGDEETTLRKMTEDLKEAVKTLEEREQQVVNAFYGLEHARLTMAEIAEDMGLKRERVRQIRDKALRKMARTTNNPILRELLRD